MILDRHGDPIKIERKSLSTELATFTSATGTSLDVLPDPDPVLQKRGDDATVLDALAADDQVTMAMQLRKRKVTNKGDYDFSPGQPDKGKSATAGANKLCSNLTLDLTGIKLKTIFNGILDANFYGYSVFELYWAVDGGRYKLIHMEEKPREWFGFRPDGTFYFNENGEAKDVPYGKFLVVRHEPTYKNPYGLRLLSRCLWPVAFKRAGIDWTMKYLERYGMAWQVAKAPANFEEKDRRALASALAAMVQDAVAVLPHGSEHQVVSVGYEGGASGFLEFLDFWNASISKVLSCQTQSFEISGSTGTYASSKTHYEVLGDVTTADELLTVDAMNDLAVIYANVNQAKEYPPVFGYTEAEDHMAQADLDKKRFSVGVRFTKAHFERQGLDSDEFYLVDPTTGPSNHRKTRSDYSFASGEFTEEQQALEELADGSMDDAGDGITGFQKSLLECVSRAKDFDELLQLLETAFPDASMGTFEEILSQAMTAASMYGRYTLIEGDA